MHSPMRSIHPTDDVVVHRDDTVGYGDVSPITAEGKLIGALTAIMGVCTVALLTGIVGAGFSKQMSKQYAEFEQKLREALDDGIISSEEAEKSRSSGAYGPIEDSGGRVGASFDRVETHGVALQTEADAQASRVSRNLNITGIRLNSGSDVRYFCSISVQRLVPIRHLK